LLHLIEYVKVRAHFTGYLPVKLAFNCAIKKVILVHRSEPRRLVIVQKMHAALHLVVRNCILWVGNRLFVSLDDFISIYFNICLACHQLVFINVHNRIQVCSSSNCLLQLHQVIPFIRRWSKLLMHYFECIRDGIVFSLKSPKTCEDLIVDTLYKHYFFKWVIVLNLRFLQLCRI